MQRGIFMSVTTNEAIKRAIGIAGSQAELARKAGVNQSTVSKWLNGAGDWFTLHQVNCHCHRWSERIRNP
jgi:predicted transcriptional regulator